MDDYPPTPYQTSRSPIMLLNLLIGAVAVACLAAIGLIFAGYGTVHVNIPSDATLQINGHKITSTSLKLRPGSYQVVVSSPTITPLQDTLRVGLLQTSTYSPTLKARDPVAIISSVIGAAEQSGAPQVSKIKWFSNNTWLTALIVPGGSRIALHYNATTREWTPEFYEAQGYPQDFSKIPADVATYLASIGAQDARQ